MIDGSKLHWISLVSYAREKDVQEVLIQKSDRYVYANYIVHDADTVSQSDLDEWTRTHTKDEICPWTVGQPKPKHEHILLGFEQERKFNEVRGWFKKASQEDGSVANTFLQRCEDPAAYEEYEIHSTEEAQKALKHQYAEEDIRVLKGADIQLPHKKQLKQEQKEDENEQLLDDIIAKKPKREMLRKYGRDYMKNWQAYEKYAQMVIFEETGKIDPDLGRDPIVTETASRAFEHGLQTAIQSVKALLLDGMEEREKDIVAEQILTSSKVNGYTINEQTGEVKTK